jgi:hypothetical protein
MSMPGYTFTPAQAGETIVLYGAGSGLPGSVAAAYGGASTPAGAMISVSR